MKDYRMIELAALSIDCSGPWLFWPEQPSELLIRSIRDYGQLEPVLLHEFQGGYSLISGLKRLRACSANDQNVLGITLNCSELEKGHIYLHSNLQRISGAASLLPAARFFQKRLLQDEWSSFWHSELSQLLNRKELKLLDDWLRSDGDWDYLVCSGHISLETAPWICGFSRRDLCALEPFLSSMYWSRNNSVSFVKWIFEIAQSRDLTVQQFLEHCSLPELLQEEISPRDCQKKILDLLRAERFPNLYSLEAEFSRLQKEVASGTGWKVIPEQNFETDRLYLQAKVEGPADLESAVQGLGEIKDRGSLHRIWQWKKDNLD